MNTPHIRALEHHQLDTFIEQTYAAQPEGTGTPAHWPALEDFIERMTRASGEFTQDQLVFVQVDLSAWDSHRTPANSYIYLAPSAKAGFTMRGTDDLPIFSMTQRSLARLKHHSLIPLLHHMALLSRAGQTPQPLPAPPEPQPLTITHLLQQAQALRPTLTPATAPTPADPTQHPKNPQPLTPLQWDILAGLLIGLSIGAISTPFTLIALPFSVYAYTLAKRGKAGAEAQQSPLVLPQHAPAQPATALSPNFQNIQLSARAESLRNTEQEVQALLEHAQANGVTDTSELTALLEDLTQLQASLKLEERQLIHHRTAELRNYVDSLKAEGELPQPSNLPDTHSDPLKL